MNVLTDDEIYELHARHYGKMYGEYTRAIEAAIMAKFERVGIVDFEGRLWSGADKDMPSDRPIYTLKEPK